MQVDGEASRLNPGTIELSFLNQVSQTQVSQPGVLGDPPDGDTVLRSLFYLKFVNNFLVFA